MYIRQHVTDASISRINSRTNAAPNPIGDPSVLTIFRPIAILPRVAPNTVFITTKYANVIIPNNNIDMIWDENCSGVGIVPGVIIKGLSSVEANNNLTGINTNPSTMQAATLDQNPA